MACEIIKSSVQAGWPVVEAELKARGYKAGPQLWVTAGLKTIAIFALFVIGCMGAAGTFPGSAIGWITVGISGGGFLLSLGLGKFKKRKFQLIILALITAVMVTVGTLGGTGVLSTAQVGWGIIGITIAGGIASLVAERYDMKRNKKLSASVLAG